MTERTITSTSGNDAIAVHQAKHSGQAPYPEPVQQNLVFGPGFGQDSISVSTAAYHSPGGSTRYDPQPYTIRFEAGIAPQDIELISLPDQFIQPSNSRFESGWSTQWQLRVKNTADVIKIFDYGNKDHSALRGLVQISFADGTVWTPAQVQAVLATAAASQSDIYGSAASEIITGDAINRKIYGGNGDDTLVAGAGSELLDGGAGANTYRIGVDSGHDTLSNLYSASGYVLEFGSGLSSKDVIPSRNGNDLLLSLPQGHTLLLQGFGHAYVTSGSSFQRATFSDGTSMDAAAIFKAHFQASTGGDDVLKGTAASELLDGAAGNDIILAFGVGDTLLGGKGDDYLYSDADSLMDGGQGNDSLRGTTGTFKFGAGFGQDTLIAKFADTATTVQFTDGVKLSDLEFLNPSSSTLGSWDVHARVKATGDTLLLSGLLSIDSTQPAGKFLFSDGSTLGFQSLLQGTTAKVNSTPFAASSSISDTEGDSTYTVAASGTALSLDLFPGASTDKDVLKVTGALRSSDIHATGNAGSLSVQLGLQGSLKITTEWSAASDRLTLQFDDGGLVSLGDLRATLPSGVSSLTGTSSNDTISMNPALGTAERYTFGHGSGQDTLFNFFNNETNVALADRVILTTKDVTFSQYTDTARPAPYNTALQISVNGTNDRLYISTPPYQTLGETVVEFLDGTTLSFSDIQALIDAQSKTPVTSGLTGNFRDENFVGTSGNDVVNPGQGNDTIDLTSGGNDTLQAWRGDGNDTVLGTLDVLRLQGGISLKDLQIDASNQLSLFQNGQVVYSLQADSLSALKFDDGSVVRMADVPLPNQLGTARNDVLTGTSGQDFIRAKAGNDTVRGGTGNDRYEGGAEDDWLVDEGALTVAVSSAGQQTRTHASGGEDLYVYNQGDGNDTITDSGLSAEVDVLRFGSGISLSDITVLTRKRPTAKTAGGGTSIDTAQNFDQFMVFNIKGQGSVSVRTPGVEQGSNLLEASAGNWGIERLEFYDDSILDKARIDALMVGAPIDQVALQSGPNVLVGGSGNDTLRGQSGNDTLLGGLGNDVLDGGVDGLDVMKGEEGNDRLTGRAGTYLLEGGTGDDFLNGVGNGTLLGGDGNDSLYCRGQHVVDGGAGADKIFVDLYQGSYTVMADAEDTLEIDRNFSDAVVSMGGGVSESSVTLTFDSRYKLVLENLGSAGAMQFTDRLDTVQTGAWLLAEALRLAKLKIDGTPMADVLSGKAYDDILSGLQGDDTLFGAGGSDTLIGGQGNDVLEGGAGADTYVFMRGDNNDVIRADGLDVIDLSQTDILRSDMDIGKLGAKSTNSVVLTFANPNGLTDSITLEGAGQWGQLTVLFADGSSIDGNGLLAVATKPDDLTINGTTKVDVLNGKDGNDTLTGLAGNDTLAGGKGNDSLVGGKGNDTYLFNRGDGQDVIVDTDSALFNSDLLKLGGATSKQLWLTKAGNNLDIKILGTSDKVTVQNWFAGSSNRVEKITASDGKSLSASKVQALVNAMASFTPPADAASLPANAPATLTKLVASSWA